MDESMFESEWKRGSDAIRRLGCSWTRDPDELDELVALAWSLAWEKRDSFRGDGDFVGWLVALGRTVCTRERERRRREQAVPLSEAIPDDVVPDHISERRARAHVHREDELLNIIMTLPPRQRAAIIARYCFGYSVKKLAETMGRSEETAKSTLAQAKKNLRGLTEEYRKAARGGGRLTHFEATMLYSEAALD